MFPHEQFARFGYADGIMARSRDRYGTPRSRVERNLSAWRRRLLAEKPPSPTPSRRKR